MKKIPVTVLSGFLGAGKTSVLKNILSQRGDKKFALIVNDMAALNIDAMQIEKGVCLSQSEEKLIQMSNGCICCTLREDLLVQVQELAKGNYDGIIIESSGISEPVPVAQTFSYQDEESGIDLTKNTRLDCMVSVVDASNFLDYFFGTKNISDIEKTENENSLAQLLTDQIELCNVLILNKTQLVSKDEIEKIISIIKGLNPELEIIKTNFGEVDIQKIFDTKKFDFEKDSQSASWLKELQNGGHHTHNPETLEYGISSFVIEKNLPLDSNKFWKLINSNVEGVIRGKGYLWIAGLDDYMIEFNIVGKNVSFGVSGKWLATFPEYEIKQSDYADYRNQVKDQKFGDRCCQFVIIGQNMDENTKNIFEECFLKDYKLGEKIKVNENMKKYLEL